MELTHVGHTQSMKHMEGRGAHGLGEGSEAPLSPMGAPRCSPQLRGHQHQVGNGHQIPEGMAQQDPEPMAQPGEWDMLRKVMSVVPGGYQGCQESVRGARGDIRGARGDVRGARGV